jgi:cytochrome P450
LISKISLLSLFNFLQGQDTTAFTVSTALLMLAMHPQVQSKVHAEISQISLESLDFNAIISLKYLDMIINETMRLFPVAPFVIRYATEEIFLDDKKIPKNTNLIVSIVNIHRDEKIWGNDSLIFRPERFEELNKIQMNSFMPFKSEFSFI